MILLLGGTSEAGPIAAALAAAGARVTVSMATGLACSLRPSERIAVRCGALDEAGLTALVRELGAVAIVDATHPYAAGISRNARCAASRTGVPLLRYLRPPAAAETAGAGGAAGEASVPAVAFASDHEDAARRAFRRQRPVLLTVGTRNLAPYLREARERSVRVVARVLPSPESRLACERAGLAPPEVVEGRGPFSAEENVALIRRHGIGVLVTKDGGAEGGVPEKLEAARREGCAVIVVARPEEGDSAEGVFAEIDALVEASLLEIRRSAHGVRSRRT